VATPPDLLSLSSSRARRGPPRTSDEIVAERASLVGSIGVIFASFGFTGAMDKLGIERRVVRGMAGAARPARGMAGAARPAREGRRGAMIYA
jgi:hypothetical protein